jgi:hypothetical protein
MVKKGHFFIKSRLEQNVEFHNASSAVNTTPWGESDYIPQNGRSACGDFNGYVNFAVTCTSIDGDTSKLKEFEAA